MKKFKTVTELQILNYACDRLLEIYLKELEIYEQNPNEFLEARTRRAYNKYNEIHDEVVRLEKLLKNEK